MPLHSTKLTQFAGAALLLGSLAPRSFAQTGSIVPSSPMKPGANAPVPSAVAPPLPASARPMTDVVFRDIEVTEVLNMISQGFDVPMVIAADVRGIILPAINLPNQTPEAAIQAIAVAAGLKYRRQVDGTYLIAKTLPEDMTVPAANSAITLPGATSPFNSSPFGPGSAAALPGIGSIGNGLDPLAGMGLDMPQLSNNNARSERITGHPIKLRYIPASMMAYWVNPSKFPMPVQLQTTADRESRYGRQPIGVSALSAQDQVAQRDSLAAALNSGFNSGFNTGTGGINPYTQQRDNAEVRANAQFGQGGQGGRGGQGGNQRGGNQRGGAGGGTFDLPEGVDRIVAIDPQNALLVFGTDEGVRELTDTIAFLDRPLRQVEIEAQFVTVQTGSTKSFGINYNTSQGNINAVAGGFAPSPPNNAGSLQVGFVRGNFQATLSALVSQNRAKIITAPRVTAINNLTATLQSQTQTPVILTTTTTGIGGQVGQGQNLIFISTNIGLTVTPTINNDDTITVLMQPELSTQTPGTGGVPGVLQQTLETIANVRDGETIALGGLKTKNIARSGDKIPLLGDLPFIGGVFRSKVATDQESDLIIFLTARIVRRADDDIVVPGT